MNGRLVTSKPDCNVRSQVLAEKTAWRLGIVMQKYHKLTVDFRNALK